MMRVIVTPAVLPPSALAELKQWLGITLVQDDAELIALLAGGTAAMPGCLAYIVSEDLKDADAIWITEIWKTKAYHDDSLKLPAVREAIAKGRPLIAGFEMSAEVKPVAGMEIKG